MEITGTTLAKALNDELVGKDVGYSCYNFAGLLIKVVRAFVKEAGLNENDFACKTHCNNTVYLTYRGTYFGDATFQKQRGKYRYGSYEWTFKNISVRLWNEDLYSTYRGLTFLEMIAKIDNDLAAQKDAEEVKLERAKKMFQKIKEELGTANNSDAVSFIDFMYKNRYAICS